jgi:hypothetical protein
MAKNEVLSVRLDADMRRRLEQFRVTSGFENPTQAARAAIVLGLGRGEGLDAEFRRVAALEATRAMGRRVRMALQAVMTELGE